ncbi:MAG: formylglycine-generating enzyme family protein [Spirulina sp. SIO3F2]|nr:formylglycine-generating enzyme family protein [Spirulina sp. SIO3F2]
MVAQEFTFESITVDSTGTITQQTPHTAQFFTENLSADVQLEMVVIPEGTFTMGAPEQELQSQEMEHLQHQVTLPGFCLGKYPITQGQWQAIVESTEPIGKKLYPNPAKFQQDFNSDYNYRTRPVERVNWYDAIEFCARLSQKTGRHYFLPSEAQWEYACRAGSQTPFHFGETISSELANYWCQDDPVLGWQFHHSSRYRQEPQGLLHYQTTPVDYFPYPNAFGLMEMHGNVAEWCSDPWHSRYVDAPTDGRVWDDQSGINYQDVMQNIGRLLKSPDYRVVRGGSWHSLAGYCRSAFRLRGYAMGTLDLQGFRVCCA